MKTAMLSQSVAPRAAVARAPRAFSSGLVHAPLRAQKVQARRPIGLKVQAMLREW